MLLLRLGSDLQVCVHRKQGVCWRRGVPETALQRWTESDYYAGLMGRSVKSERSVPMRSPVNWTVLGLVIERSSYGFELWTRFERLYGDVMPICNESSIYTALNMLREKCLIEE